MRRRNARKGRDQAADPTFIPIDPHASLNGALKLHKNTILEIFLRPHKRRQAKRSTEKGQSSREIPVR